MVRHHPTIQPRTDRLRTNPRRMNQLPTIPNRMDRTTQVPTTNRNPMTHPIPTTHPPTTPAAMTVHPTSATHPTRPTVMTQANQVRTAAKNPTTNPKITPAATTAADQAATTSPPKKATRIPEAMNPANIRVAMTQAVMIPKAKSQRMTTNPTATRAVADPVTLARALGSGRAVGNCKTATAKTPAILRPAAVPMTAKW